MKHTTSTQTPIIPQLRLALLALLLSLMSACLVSQAPDTRGWKCDSDADCVNGLFCYQSFCRATCATNKDDLDCNRNLKEVCNADFYCVPPGPICKDGETRKCYDGPAGTLGKGPCKEGTQTCQSSKWGTCTGWQGPLSETTTPCNGADDNCDGQIDEGNECLCKPNETRPCYDKIVGCTATNGQYSCKGICKAGSQTCGSNSKWGPCNNAVGPDTSEKCNGLDDDCDGQTDENVTDDKKDCTIGGKKGPCEAGKSLCKDGKLECINNHTISQEDCNGIDDDCDGGIDNFPNSTIRLFKECASNSGCKPDGSGGFKCTGTCTSGRIKCLEPQNIWSTTCEGETKPSPTEDCDGLDNDCDGQIDNNTVQEGKACSSSEVGVCKAGTIKCQAGKPFCQPNLTASPEVCDNKDNNCDGMVDNNVSDCQAPMTCTAGTCQ